MSQPVIYMAITSHGFGHTVRVSSVAAILQQLAPEIELIFATTAPQWLLESYIQSNFRYHPRIFDVGVIQSDSLTMDKKATLAKMQQIYAERNSIMAEEVDFIRKNNVNLILADIPPLAVSIAQAASIPCWMMSNFGWDFIYRSWGDDFGEIVTWIEECYQQCDRLFRLPLSEPMSAFKHITDVGLTGGIPRYSEAELRAKFGITAPKEKTILLTFGGLGLQAIPYDNLQQFLDWQFITFDRHAPNLPNLIKVTGNPYRPVDFMPICGRVLSKPGYSTFAEALLWDVPIVSLTREDFAESPLLLEGIQDYSYHQIISTEEFFQGNWDFLRQKCKSPRKPDSLAKNGAETIAQSIVDYFKGNS
ncbi:MAG: glycosyl transferase [Xenococcaceae cyanobacterium]